MLYNNILQIGGTEWIWVILAIFVLLFGSKKLPEFAKSIGKAIGEFQKGRMEFEKELRAVREQVMEMPKEIQSTASEFKSTIQDLPKMELAQVPPPTPPTPSQVEPVAQELTESQKLLKVAESLGLSVEGKTNDQLKEEIKKALEGIK